MGCGPFNEAIFWQIRVLNECRGGGTGPRFPATGEEAIVERGLRQRESTKPFRGQIFFQIPLHLPIREIFHELQEQTVKQPLDPIAVGPFELAHVCQGLSGIGQITLKPTVGMSGRS